MCASPASLSQGSRGKAFHPKKGQQEEERRTANELQDVACVPYQERARPTLLGFAGASLERYFHFFDPLEKTVRFQKISVKWLPFHLFILYMQTKKWSRSKVDVFILLLLVSLFPLQSLTLPFSISSPFATLQRPPFAPSFFTMIFFFFFSSYFLTSHITHKNQQARERGIISSNIIAHLSTCGVRRVLII